MPCFNDPEWYPRDGHASLVLDVPAVRYSVPKPVVVPPPSTGGGAPRPVFIPPPPLPPPPPLEPDMAPAAAAGSGAVVVGQPAARPRPPPPPGGPGGQLNLLAGARPPPRFPRGHTGGSGWHPLASAGASASPTAAAPASPTAPASASSPAASSPTVNGDDGSGSSSSGGDGPVVAAAAVDAGGGQSPARGSSSFASAASSESRGDTPRRSRGSVGNRAHRSSSSALCVFGLLAQGSWLVLQPLHDEFNMWVEELKGCVDDLSDTSVDQQCCITAAAPATPLLEGSGAGSHGSGAGSETPLSPGSTVSDSKSSSGSPATSPSTLASRQRRVTMMGKSAASKSSETDLDDVGIWEPGTGANRQAVGVATPVRVISVSVACVNLVALS